jgi:hypothetical protein
MKRSAVCLSAIASTLVCWQCLFAMGGNHRPGKIGKVHADWSDRLLELINFEGRVHGHWVNANDEFFYRGDTAALNRFLELYGKLEDTPLTVVIHAGSARRSALWGKKPEIAYDWKLLITRRGWGAPSDPKRPKDDPGYVVTVDVWIDGKVELEKLKVPEKIKAVSGGEIEKFVAGHEARRKNAKHEE